MDVFISWSGASSEKVAKALNEWLPSVIQSLKPYVSSENIHKGDRWSADVASKLENSGFGIICLTPENLDAPWVLFEAGALSKMVGETRVAPVLTGLKRQDVKAPLSQFQSTIIEKADFLKLVKSLNEVNREQSLEEGRLEKIFDTFWPDLEASLTKVESEIADNAKKMTANMPKEEKREVNLQSIQSTLEELVLNLRSNNRLLNNPQELLPPQYLHSILSDAGIASNHRRPSQYNLDAWRFLRKSLDKLRDWLVENEERKTLSNTKILEFRELYADVANVCRHLIKEVGDI